MAKKKQPIGVACNSCGRRTNHDVVVAHSKNGEEEGWGWWAIEYQVLRCLGCDTISFRESSWNSENIDHETGGPLVEEKLFPDRNSTRRPITGYEHFPPKTRRIYSEVLNSLGISCWLLTAIGLRTLIESICLDQKCKKKNLKERITELATKGLLSKVQAQVLHNHRFLGNLAAHEIEAPQPLEILAALEIAETLLKTIYVIPQLEKQLKPNKARGTATLLIMPPPPPPVQGKQP